MEEMIEKQITVLVAKSDEEKFNELLKGFKEFCLTSYETEERFKSQSLSLTIRSSQLKE